MRFKPINTWNTYGMASEWREKCPLAGAFNYLWQTFQADRTNEWYRNGFEFLWWLEQQLFASSSCFGRIWEEGFDHKCERPGCDAQAEGIINQRKSGIKDESGRDEYLWLIDAPRFQCYKHHLEQAFTVADVKETIPRGRAA